MATEKDKLLVGYKSSVSVRRTHGMAYRVAASFGRNIKGILGLQSAAQDGDKVSILTFIILLIFEL